MGCCSSTDTEPTALEYSQEVDRAAVQLADSLEQMPEFREFVRLARLINLDPDVKRVLSEIRSHQTGYQDDQEKTVANLEAQLEMLPAVQGYRKAELAVKDLLHSVDEVIGRAAGIPFAVNAKISGCG